MKLKDELTAESVRLESTIANDNDHTAIKAARTRWENKHRAYWKKVYEAREELAVDPKKRSRVVCALHGIDPLDLMEVTVGD